MFYWASSMRRFVTHAIPIAKVANGAESNDENASSSVRCYDYDPARFPGSAGIGSKRKLLHTSCVSLYDQAAAKCSEPGASCMRKFASYDRCLAAQYNAGGNCAA